MADYEDGIFSNLPRPRRRPGQKDDDDDDRRLSPRQLLAMNFVPEGPLPKRPRPSGKGGSAPAANAPPLNGSPPSVAGTPAVGQTLTCSTGGWYNVPTSYTYQWLKDGANIAGATSSTYVVVAGDLGHSISCKVTATNSFGSTSATSNALVIGAIPVNSVAPVISGTATVGSLLSCTQGTWTNSPTSYAYQWQRGGVNIGGATSSTYTTIVADGGTSTTCVVTATNATGSASATSNALAIAGIPANTAAPVASGTATVGSTLSSTNGTWTNSPTSYAYQWLQNGVNISGATASTYVVASGDAGTSIRCSVTATNSAGSASMASNALAIAALPSAPVNTVAPVASGTLTVGSTLSCTQGTWTNSPTGYTYQWLQNGVNISGATASTYVTVTADGGTSVSCRVAATNAGGTTSIASNSLAIAAGGATSVWSSADAAANAMTLTNGGLTAQAGSGGGWQSIRATIGKTSGKLYIEFFDNAIGSAVEEWGLASSGFNPVGYFGQSNFSGGLGSNGYNLVSTGFTDLGPFIPVTTSVVGDVWAMAVDFGAGYIWISRNNTWYSGNPATGTAPMMSFSIATTGALFPGMAFSSPGDRWTLQPTAASQTYAPPSGFTPWG